jgi:hypothetical protein
VISKASKWCCKRCDNGRLGDEAKGCRAGPPNLKPSPNHEASRHQAASIQWGIELETRLPASAGVQVGAYHYGLPVQGAIDAARGCVLATPAFNGAPWKAERDGYIRCDAGLVPYEFVSPILPRRAGVEHLISFVEWLSALCATVDRLPPGRAFLGTSKPTIGPAHRAVPDTVSGHQTHAANHVLLAVIEAVPSHPAAAPRR